MLLFTKIQDYFKTLVEALVTTQRLEEMFGKLKEKIMKDLKKNSLH